MIIADIVFDEFFSRPLPIEGFEIDPTGAKYFGLIGPDSYERSELYGYEITMDGDIVVPELRPTQRSHGG